MPVTFIPDTETENTAAPSGIRFVPETEKPSGRQAVEWKTGQPLPAEADFSLFGPSQQAKEHTRDLLGSSFVDESLFTSPQDLELAWRFGWAQSEEKKRRIIQDLYGPDADVSYKKFSDGSTIQVATKDGKSWYPIEGVHDFAKDIPETAVGLTPLGGPTAAGLGALRMGQAALGAFGASLGSESLLKSFYEPERTSPIETAVQDALGAGLGQLGGDLASVLFRRTFGTVGSPGAEEAQRAAREEGLPPITGGQFTENPTLKSAYVQVQDLSTKVRADALRRFEAMRGRLENLIGVHGLDAFKKEDLEALAAHAAIEIEKSVMSLSASKLPIGEVLPRLQEALDVFNATSSKHKNSLYQKAFEVGVKDGVELDFLRVKKAISEIEKGVPISTPTGDPVRLLTPSGELSTLIERVKQVSNTLSTHNPDGNMVGALEQMNAIRRGFSDYAWENAGTNQGRLALQVLEAIDESLASPVAGASKAYEAAFKQAQEANAAWRTAMEIKKVSSLNDADLSSYQGYIANLMKPGNGPVLKLMEDMFKGTPGAMDDVRAAFVDTMVRDPSKIEKTLDLFQKADPAMLDNMIPSKADRNLLRQYAKERERFERSWVFKQREKEALSEGERALTLFEGGESQIAQNVKDYLDYAGEGGREALQAAFLQRALKASETEPSTLLGAPVIDADQYVAYMDSNKALFDTLFPGEQGKSIMNLYNYGLKIKSTGTGVPALKGRGSGGGDTGASMQKGERAAVIGRAPATLASGGVGGLAKQYFSMLASPLIMSKMLGLSQPAKEGVTKSGIKMTEGGLRAIQNITRVIPNILSEDIIEYGPEADVDNIPGL